MSEKINKKRMNYRLLVVVLVVSMLILLFAVFAKIFVLQRYVDSVRQSEIVGIRELIINASESTKVDAPIDHKTGDIYFPHVNLYLPNESNMHQLTYSYYMNDETGVEVSVSDKTLFMQNVAKLYSARNINELFKAVPKLQSCQRGVILSYSELSSEFGRVLKETVTLDNGKTLYLYAENSCSELVSTIGLLKGVKPY